MLSDSVIEECSELEKVLLTWTDKKLIEGSEFEQGYFESCITEGDLPPVEGASKDNYRFKSIYLKEVNKLIGFFDVYLGYPTRDCVWISIFVIDGTYRKKSYAQEVIKLVAEESKRSGFSKIGIGVYLNNWRALRFWTKAGFDKVKGIYGDGEYQVSKYGLIGLEKYL
jgi:ribosomal protein S18 acetylase RimI-like enzyme